MAASALTRPWKKGVGMDQTDGEARPLKHFGVLKYNDPNPPIPQRRDLAPRVKASPRPMPPPTAEDSVLQAMGASFSTMDAADLTCYFAERWRLAHGFSYPFTPGKVKEVAIFRRLQRRWGR